MGVEAPVIRAEMNDWIALGGGDSGIVGNALHDYGFHVAADELPVIDYSRQRDPNGPNGPFTSWDYACAGDFSHRNDEGLRTKHREVLARLMRGEFPMICEFIGKPWADRPVYYWARWNGISYLELYTGSGHDTWSHISWYRSMADQRPYLWTPPAVSPTKKRNKKMFVILQPNKEGSGIGLAWPDAYAKGWVYTNIIPPGSSSERTEFPAEVVAQYLAAGAIDGRGWNVASWDGFIELAKVPRAVIEMGPVNVSVPPLKVVPL